MHQPIDEPDVLAFNATRPATRAEIAALATRLAALVFEMRRMIRWLAIVAAVEAFWLGALCALSATLK